MFSLCLSHPRGRAEGSSLRSDTPFLWDRKVLHCLLIHWLCFPFAAGDSNLNSTPFRPERSYDVNLNDCSIGWNTPLLARSKTC
jgi:hypothetical protein